MRTIRIGTRGSRLARWQANAAAAALKSAHPGMPVEVVVITTAGDRTQGSDTGDFEGTGAFTKEIEVELLEERIDLAVHSLKDLPVMLPHGLVVGATLKRGDPADALINDSRLRLMQLPRGAVVLTGSPRRVAQILHRRPDLVCKPVRGNVPTRLQKTKDTGADGIVLACAGLARLEMSSRITERFEPEEFLPACGQGAMALEVRASDEELVALCGEINDMPTQLATGAERGFLATLGGGCTAPAGAYGRFVGGGDELTLTAMLAMPSGAQLITRTLKRRVSGMEAAGSLGEEIALLLRDAGGDDILRAVRASGLAEEAQ